MVACLDSDGKPVRLGDAPWQVHDGGRIGRYGDSGPTICRVTGPNLCSPIFDTCGEYTEADLELAAAAPWHALLLRAVLKGWRLESQYEDDGVDEIPTYCLFRYEDFEDERIGIPTESVSWRVRDNSDLIPACPDAETFERIRKAVDGE